VILLPVKIIRSKHVDMYLRSKYLLLAKYFRSKLEQNENIWEHLLPLLPLISSPADWSEL